MRSLGVRKLYVLDDQDPFEVPLATIVAGDAERAGIAVPAHESISTVAGRGLHRRGRKDRRKPAQTRCSWRAAKAPARPVLWRELQPTPIRA